MFSVGFTRFPGRLDRPYSNIRRLMLETVILAVRTLEILSFALLALQSPVYGQNLIWLQYNIFFRCNRIIVVITVLAKTESHNRYWAYVRCAVMSKSSGLLKNQSDNKQSQFQEKWPNMRPVVLKLLRQQHVSRDEWQDLFWYANNFNCCSAGLTVVCSLGMCIS